MEAVSGIDAWTLSPDVTHLNHGSYGGCPRAVTEAAAAIRARFEAAPMRFFVLEWQTELDRARAALAAFVRAPDERLAFVTNATHAVAIALRSTPIASGDEIITTDHAYRACKNQLDRTGARIVVVPIALPYDPAQLAAAIERAVTPRTVAALLDHITSPTALRLPLEQLVPKLVARGIAVIVDGAHAPGQIELDVGAIGATWYAGNNHKWVCAPKASGFLVAGPTAPPHVPVVTSHGASPEYGPPNRYHAELDWTGTHDPVPHLSVPHAIDTIARLGGGWPAVIGRNHALAIELRRRVIDALGGAPLLAPDTALGTMATIPIALPANTTPLELQRRLLLAGWEVPIFALASGPFVRISAHLYNHAAQADALAAKLRELGVTLR